jgi:SOS response associated peptidase (SRAP)
VPAILPLGNFHSFKVVIYFLCVCAAVTVEQRRKKSSHGSITSRSRSRSDLPIIGEPNELVAQIHPRMPVILPEQHHATWLGETDNGNLKELLLPYPADQMRMWEISPRANSPKNDDPLLWEPLHAEPTQTTTDALERESNYQSCFSFLIKDLRLKKND